MARPACGYALLLLGSFDSRHNQFVSNLSCNSVIGGLVKQPFCSHCALGQELVHVQLLACQVLFAIGSSFVFGNVLKHCFRAVPIIPGHVCRTLQGQFHLCLEHPVTLPWGRASPLELLQALGRALPAGALMDRQWGPHLWSPLLISSAGGMTVPKHALGRVLLLL